jgi:hypothetical protein
MTDDLGKDAGKALALAWGHLITKKNFDSALFTGIVGYLVALESKDPDLKAGAMLWIETAIRERQEAEGDRKSERHVPECSFCGQSEPAVRLVAGAKAFICDGCVKMCTEIFATEPSSSA